MLKPSTVKKIHQKQQPTKPNVIVNFFVAMYDTSKDTFYLFLWYRKIILTRMQKKLQGLRNEKVYIHTFP